MTFEETKRLLEANRLRALILRQPWGKGCLLVAPDLSGKIMAVSLNGPSGENFGFVNEKAIANRGNDPRFNAYGGALRWWVGPEGGQFGVAFPPGTREFNLDSWYISEEYNGKRFEVMYPEEFEGIATEMRAECRVQNASGARFHLGVSCRISLLDIQEPSPAGAGAKSAARNSQINCGSSCDGGSPESIPRNAGSRQGCDFAIAQLGRYAEWMKVPIAQRGYSHGPLRELSHLGYLCETSFQNLSDEPMRKETGLVSIWMLGMYAAGARSCVIVPFERNGSGRIVTDTYFSPDGLTRDRLFINKRVGYMLFRADGKERSKIGISRSRASAMAGTEKARSSRAKQNIRIGSHTAIGSIDFGRKLLTIWRFPVHRRKPYVNSLWEWQKRPYSGDVINSYNDDGKIGNFYELECSSPALALAPGERTSFSLEIHHFSGPPEKLLLAAEGLLGRRVKVGLKQFLMED